MVNLFLWLGPPPSKLKKCKSHFFHCGAELWKFVIPVSRREALWHIMIHLQKSLEGFPCKRSAGKESTCSAGDPSLIPGSERSPRKGIGYPLQYSGLENSMDCIVHGVTESDTTERLALTHFLKSHSVIFNPLAEALTHLSN